MKRNPAFVKLTEWEHWPTFAFYIPLLPIFLWRSIKAGHPFFFTITNPGILFSGCGTESKYKTLALVPEPLRPKSHFLSKSDFSSDLQSVLNKNGFKFPLIVKPDIGFRGYLVKKIGSIEELKKYLHHFNENVIIQEFIPFEKELGIFYHRFPEDELGSITSVTIKKFIRINGDGILTISELIQNDSRAVLYSKLFHNLHRDKLNHVLKKDEKMTLSVIGNHSKGTQFINGNHLINEELNTFVNKICKQMKGFNYGRLDIKYKDYEDLLKGENFKVLEANGIISEPTHIYDPLHENASYYQALKSINLHWGIMAIIAKKIRKDRHIRYPSVSGFCKHMIWLMSYTKKLKKLNSQDF